MADRKTYAAADEHTIIGWDVRTWSRALAFWNSILPGGGNGKRALELGCGEGGLSLWLAQKGYQVCCTDLDQDFSAAKQLHSAFGVAEQIEYAHVDACTISGENSYDIIVFKSVLGAIGRAGGVAAQQLAIEEMWRALCPGGLVLFAENLQATWLHMRMRRLFVRWGDAWRYPTFEELHDFFSLFSEKELHATGYLAAFGKGELMRGALARIDAAIFDHVTSDSSRYLGYGFARKL